MGGSGGGDSKIGSCTQVIRSNGEIFAVAHPHKKTGYKSANSETNMRMLGSKTTYKQFFEDEVALPTVTKNPKGMSYRSAILSWFYRMCSTNSTCCSAPQYPVCCCMLLLCQLETLNNANCKQHVFFHPHDLMFAGRSWFHTTRIRS